MELCSSASWSCHHHHHMSIFAQQRVDVCLQFRSKFNVSVLCAFTYVLLLQDCVCVCVYLTCVCQIFFSRLQRCRCASQGETQREMQCKGVTWKESHDHVSLLEAWWIGFKQQSSHCVCRFVSVLSKKKTVQSVLSLLNVTELFGIESERCFVCYIVLN